MISSKVNWDSSRYEEIVEDLKPFLVQTGFSPQKTKFVPVSAMSGINLAQRFEGSESLGEWYKGPSLVDLLGMERAKL